MSFRKRAECMRALVCLSIDHFDGVERMPYGATVLLMCRIYLAEIEQIDGPLAQAAV